MFYQLRCTKTLFHITDPTFLDNIVKRDPDIELWSKQEMELFREDHEFKNLVKKQNLIVINQTVKQQKTVYDVE